jgi:transcriptional regulator with XRE-family HTH domain
VFSEVYTNGGALKLDRDRLQRAREMLGYGLEKTAQEAGISKNSVLRAEHEEDIRPVTARKIAAALDVPVADLIGESETLKAQPPLPDFWGKWRSQLELLEMCVQYAIGRTEYYEQKLEQGRTREYGRAEPAYILAIHAMEEFSSIIRWVFDGPVGPLRMALDHCPGADRVDPRIADEIANEFDAKEEAMIERISRTQRMLFDNAAQVAETEAQRDVLAAKLQQSVVDIEDLRRLRDERREAANKVSATGA